MEMPRCCIATATTESEAEHVRLRLLDLGVKQAWKSWCELTTTWAVYVRSEDARGAYSRLKANPVLEEQLTYQQFKSDKEEYGQ